MRRWLCAVWLAGGCGEATDTAAAADPSPTVSAGAAAVLPGDELLARARASIREGRVAPALVAELEASSEPRHVHAARLLAALSGGRPGGEAPRPAEEADAPDDTPRLRVGEAPEVEPEPDSTPPADPAEATAPSPPAAKRPSKIDVSALSLARTSKGATLTIKAPGGVTVGIANQPASGLVHLVIEGASASPKVVSARPSIAGARVTRVRRGEGTVQITLDLEPGWTLGSVRRFAGGAKVNLQAPP
jgi:hypothetical protein